MCRLYANSTSFYVRDLRFRDSVSPAVLELIPCRHRGMSVLHIPQFDTILHPNLLHYLNTLNLIDFQFQEILPVEGILKMAQHRFSFSTLQKRFHSFSSVNLCLNPSGKSFCTKVLLTMGDSILVV